MGYTVGSFFFEASRNCRGYTEIKERNWGGVGLTEYVQLYFHCPQVPVLAFTAKQARVLAAALLEGATHIDGQAPEDDGVPGWGRNDEYGPHPVVARSPPSPRRSMDASFGVDAVILSAALDQAPSDPV